MSEKDLVVWSKDRLLSWSDFKAESNPAVYEDSHSYIRYHYTWTVNSEKMGREILFYIEDLQIHVHFHKLLSWVRESEITDSLLLHEQGHFDLAEKIRHENVQKIIDVFYDKKFATRGQNEEQRKQNAKEDSGILISQEVEKLEKILSQKRKEYDSLTEYGNNQSEQQKFNQAFAAIH
ncbi:hypothetical protein [Nitrosopumilus sp.]|uniref:hypothetical protein n=1 Tax=Nitrosopumilus sp. TaxID=2024843 RepID=UPI0026381FED|nr:hypothetical protein [Nitrosopumilus sp.]